MHTARAKSVSDIDLACRYEARLIRRGLLSALSKQERIFTGLRRAGQCTKSGHRKCCTKQSMGKPALLEKGFCGTGGGTLSFSLCFYDTNAAVLLLCPVQQDLNKWRQKLKCRGHSSQADARRGYFADEGMTVERHSIITLNRA